MAGREFIPTPERLVDETGKVNFGTFKTPIPLVNPLDADVLDGYPIPQMLKTLRLKEWQAFQIANERFFIFVVLFNGKVLANAQVKIYDRVLKKKYVYERKIAPWSLPLPTNLLDSETSFHGNGCHMSFRNLLSKNAIVLTIDIAESEDFPRVVGSIVACTENQDLLVVSIPFASNSGMYSTKGIVKATGNLCIGQELITFQPNNSYVLLDDHKGYYPVSMNWDWVTGGGHLADGRRVGWNFTHNQSLDQEAYNENCLWINSTAHLLPPVTFERLTDDDTDDIDESERRCEWKVKDEKGRVDITFHPEVTLNLDINLVLICCQYRGPFGYFKGHIITDDGEKIVLDGLFGMGEDFYLRC